MWLLLLLVTPMLLLMSAISASLLVGLPVVGCTHVNLAASQVDVYSSFIGLSAIVEA